MRQVPLLLFTDLDGTLLDHQTYEWRAAGEALALLRAQQIPLIINSSKTLAECRAIQRQLQLQGPVIFENGAGVALPVADWPAPGGDITKDTHEWVKSFAVPYKQVRQVLQDLRREQFMFTGFGDMSIAEISRATGLPHSDAARAKSRRFGEPVVWQDSAWRRSDFIRALRDSGLTCTRGGRFMHVAGTADKGSAMLWLVEQYPGPRPCIVALGDSDNDIPMLSRADIAVLVRAPTHPLPPFTDGQQPHRLLVTDECGPAGWNRAVLTLVEEYANG